MSDQKLWTEVDGFLADRLVQSDAALEAALPQATPQRQKRGKL